MHISTAIARFLIVLCFFAPILINSCASPKLTKPIGSNKKYTVTDYSDLKTWAAHPDKNDPADRIPKESDLKNEQNQSEVDVFFLHPTSLTKGSQWNGDLQDAALNKKTDEGSILYQASIFNGAGRVFAPRYRQANLQAYYTKDTASALTAFDMAYFDLKTAFEYYLKNWNKGRPIIIAAHSQGTQHAKQLMKEYFDGQSLGNRLVVAYLVGMPVTKDYFKNIPVCETPQQTGCFCSWRTFKEGYEPTNRSAMNDKIAVVNPLSWTTDDALVSKTQHKGYVLMGFKAIKEPSLSAQVHKGILWVEKPSFKGSFLWRTDNYHVGDYNLFYFNIREDAKRRVGLFWKR